MCYMPFLSFTGTIIGLTDSFVVLMDMPSWHLFRVNDGNIGPLCENSSKPTIKTPGQR